MGRHGLHVLTPLARPGLDSIVARRHVRNQLYPRFNPLWRPGARIDAVEPRPDGAYSRTVGGPAIRFVPGRTGERTTGVDIVRSTCGVCGGRRFHKEGCQLAREEVALAAYRALMDAMIGAPLQPICPCELGYPGVLGCPHSSRRPGE